MNWTDTHAHIFLDEFASDRIEMMARCEDQFVNRIYMPNIDHTSVDAMLSVEAQFPGICFAMMGLHPCSVKQDFEKELYQVEDWLSKRKFSAIGEIGTDLYWDKTHWGAQQEAFKVQIGWAKQYKLPVVIHCRESIDETIQLLQGLHAPNLKGVFHCFTGTVSQAARITEMGFYLGLGGVTTFKNGGLDSVVPTIDLDAIVLETDSPYLSPVPYRGKRNEPSYIPIIAKKVAEWKQVSLEELSRVTNYNADRLFQVSTKSLDV